MDGVEAIKRAVGHSHEWYEGTVADLTQQQADFLPPGTAHPIGEIVTHVLQAEDMIVSGMLQGQPSVWERDGWEAKLGIPNVAQHTQEMARGFKGDLAALQPYKEAVFASTQAYLDSLSEADLDREIDGMGEQPTAVADVITNALVGNNLAHTGEISALKGVQGAKGYPF